MRKSAQNIFLLMTTFYDFALKIETSWTKEVVKSSLKTWNDNDVVLYVWFIYSQIKKNLKIYDVKKPILNAQSLQ